MRPLVVVMLQPSVQIDLQFFQRMVQFTPEGNLVKFVQDGFVEAFADTVCLWMPRFGLGVFYAVYAKIQLIIVFLELCRNTPCPCPSECG